MYSVPVPVNNQLAFIKQHEKMIGRNKLIANNIIPGIAASSDLPLHPPYNLPSLSSAGIVAGKRVSCITATTSRKDSKRE
jgi:hypothetical protein